MSEQEKAVVIEYCQRMDDRHKRLVTVLYTLLGIMLGGLILVLVSFGEVRAQGNANATEVVKKVDRTEFNSVYDRLNKIDGISDKVNSLEGMMKEHVRTTK